MPTDTTEDTRGEDRELIASLARGLDVIKVFSRERPALTLAEVARTTGLNPATARRCLRTLERLGYVGRNERRFMLKPRVLDLAASFLDSISIEDLCRTQLQDIVNRTGDTASLSILDGGEIVYLAHVATKRILRLEASVGTRYPAYPTSMGRVLLGQLPDADLDRYLAETDFAALTERTVTDRKKLRRAILDAREKGYAAVKDELAYGVLAVAVPVFDESGFAVAAINSSAHSMEVDEETIVEQRVPILLRAAEMITESLRHFPILSLSVRA